MKIIEGNDSALFNDAAFIRNSVFVKEQGFSNEFDDIDRTCTHIILYDNDKPIATGRLYKENDNFHLGRIAVLKEYRNQHIGSKILTILQNIAKEKGAFTLELSAQHHLTSFYEKNGYTTVGNPYMDEHCLHIKMKKTIDN